MKHLLIVIFCFFQYFSIAQISDFSHIDFTKANNIVKLNEGKDLNNLPLLTFQLTHKLSTDVEKFRAIYLWVSHNIEGDAQQHNLVNRKKKNSKQIVLDTSRGITSSKKPPLKNYYSIKKQCVLVMLI
ncbi:hypothetical protein [Winogradskyella sp.]|jgi:hypothetical protein|uniref:hypothetical protein n=1 Tax=Winogradskyella sp. TaxID=1883156 RepID=UPI0025FC193D|nr:hypothetical protein [Winogradskyella sp.]MCT4628600.1 hypothetical protein [Winogradskyella sp.]